MRTIFISTLVAVLVVGAASELALARGGGGGGSGGGSRGFSGGGSIRYSGGGGGGRPAARPSTPAVRPSTPTARPGAMERPNAFADRSRLPNTSIAQHPNNYGSLLERPTHPVERPIGGSGKRSDSELRKPPGKRSATVWRNHFSNSCNRRRNE